MELLAELVVFPVSQVVQVVQPAVEAEAEAVLILELVA
jgi:hypothetical protein